MTEPHDLLNELPVDEARAALFRCCGSRRWVAEMLARRPWLSDATLYGDAGAVWAAMGRDDILEAFAQHPRIGDSEGAGTLSGFPQSIDAWSLAEQSGTAGADAGTRRALREANQRYFDHFGYIFIVCATGKSAAEMLALIQQRLHNDPTRELAIAAAEQARITRLRLEKLGA
ncbi:MAG TPA: 2-oxo-4-hydroxy-4-carboxy-5-ureidoimidazoline decarboxylase [Polyangia bacterium]|nr:2-oxo-4-hydroxy-4-carboxy-5-ureidoimidazoline decarboxylase [Polyangia bacterium]